jgi:hypothetical protein
MATLCHVRVVDRGHLPPLDVADAPGRVQHDDRQVGAADAR